MNSKIIEIANELRNLGQQEVALLKDENFIKNNGDILRIAYEL